jgi:hypothetical protein
MGTSNDKRTTALFRVLGQGGPRRFVPAALLVLGILGLVAYALPGGGRNALWETAAWSILVIVSFAGWGSVVHHFIAPRERIDLGLRVIWGASLLCFVGGTLMVPALMKRMTALAVIEIGLVLALITLVRERSAVHARASFIGRLCKREPRLCLVAGIVAFVLAIQFLSGIADWHTNPYDDDIAYLAFVKKLNDTGTVLEPFSFRRLSALGGQTFFVQLVSIRATASQGNTFDRSICTLIVAMLIAGYRARGRRASIVFVLITVMFVVTLPSAAINTASYYSGVAFFLGLFRTIAWLADRPRAAWQSALPLALVSAAACTLRQNYLPVPVFVLATSYGFHVWKAKGPFVERLAEPLLTLVFTSVAIAPWLITSWQSSRTFVYPLMLGTFNRALMLNASGMNLIREVWYQVWTALDGIGMKTFGLFVLAAALLRERSSRRPVWSMAIGSAAGFTLLVHGFTQSDAANIGRYAFAVLMVFAIAITLAAGTTRLETKPGRDHMMIGVVLFAVLAQLAVSREDLLKTYTTAFHNIEELHYSAPRSAATLPFEAGLYDRLQRSVPQGERIAVMLDEPHYLDFERNPIWNLDMPGYASLPPGMPFFKGSAALAAYFRTVGVRYLAFVGSSYSRYHYRREYWIEMLGNEQEIWRAFSPYLLDFMDMLTDLSKGHRKLFEERGLVVLDLAEAP